MKSPFGLFATPTGVKCVPVLKEGRRFKYSELDTASSSKFTLLNENQDPVAYVYADSEVMYEASDETLNDPVTDMLRETYSIGVLDKVYGDVLILGVGKSGDPCSLPRETQDWIYEKIGVDRKGSS